MPAHDCALTGARGVLGIQSTGDDPYLFGPPIRIEGLVTARLRMKCAGGGGDGQVFWLTEKMTAFDEAHSQRFALTDDNQWHDYTVALAPGGVMRQLRLDPAERPGVIEVESIELLRETPHPLEIQSVRTEGASVSARLKNYSPRALSFTMDEQPFVLGPNATGEFSEIVPGEKPFRPHDIVIDPRGCLRFIASLQLLTPFWPAIGQPSVQGTSYCAPTGTAPGRGSNWAAASSAFCRH